MFVLVFVIMKQSIYLFIYPQSIINTNRRILKKKLQNQIGEDKALLLLIPETRSNMKKKFIRKIFVSQMLTIISKG